MNACNLQTGLVNETAICIINDCFIVCSGWFAGAKEHAVWRVGSLRCSHIPFDLALSKAQPGSQKATIAFYGWTWVG